MQEQSSCFLGIFGTRTRFFILPLVLLCLSFIWANILSFNLVTVCINNEAAASNSSQLTISQSKSFALRQNMFLSAQTTYSIAAMAVGALAGNFPAVYFVNRYGSRVVFTLLGLLTSVATVALPPAINVSLERIERRKVALERFWLADSLPSTTRSRLRCHFSCYWRLYSEMDLS